MIAFAQVSHLEASRQEGPPHSNHRLSAGLNGVGYCCEQNQGNIFAMLTILNRNSCYRAWCRGIKICWPIIMPVMSMLSLPVDQG